MGWSEKFGRDWSTCVSVAIELLAAAASTYLFVMDNEFLNILGPNPGIVDVVNSDAHEGLVYYPNENAILFTTQGDLNKSCPNKVKKLSLETNEQDDIFPETDFANGMTLDCEGNLLICEQGSVNVPAYILRVNLRCKSVDEGKKLPDQWLGLHFNGPNDIVVKSDGSIWFTDPDYPCEQGFKGKPEIPKNRVFRIGTDNTVDAVDPEDDSFRKPNGLAFTPDESKIYVTDTGYKDGDPEVHETSFHNIFVFDVVGGSSLKNKKPFARIFSLDGCKVGSPDGIKVDTAGRVYVGTTDGVRVLNDKGVNLGHIQVPHAVTIGFAGPLLDTLYIFNNDVVKSMKLEGVTGAGLHYAGKFHKIPYYMN